MGIRAPFVGLALVLGLNGAAVRAVPKPSPPETYNTVLGTQSFGPSYQFSRGNWLVETARAIRDMGSSTIKFALDVPKPLHGDASPHGPDLRTLADVARRDPSVRAVLDMPFANYVLWAYPRGVPGDQFRPENLPAEYRQMYDLTRTLLTDYRGTGKTFYLGNWEGDWHLLHLNPNYAPTPLEIANMAAWINNRQKAVDDARRDTPSRDIRVYCYLEVNRVVDARQGRTRLTNAVLPKTSVDFVSYSCYDALGGDTEATLVQSLDYIQSQLPPKAGLSGKRVFIGEYGFPAAVHSPQEQDALSRRVMRAGLLWGCPFVLYWELYNNEVVDHKQRGFWLIDDQGVKQPIYETHRRFYAQARQYVTDFRKKRQRVPTRAEFGVQAASWLGDVPASDSSHARAR